MKEKDREFMRSLYVLASLGINIVVATFIGLGMGWLLDNRFFPRYFHWDSSPIFTLVFLLFGIIAGFRNVFMMTKGKLDRIDEDKGETKGDFRDKDNKNDN